MSVDSDYVRSLFTVKPWEHQERGVAEVISKISPGRMLCLTSPTGGGKSKIMEALARHAVRSGMNVDLKVHRRMLLKQLVEGFDRAGIPIGVRAASMPDRFDPECPVQITSMQTDHARCMRAGATQELHKAGLVLVDEAHVQCGKTAENILRKQADDGAAVVGITATPLGVSHIYKDLVIAGTNSELRKCGAHVKCIVKAPFEFDLSDVKRDVTGEFKIGDTVKKIFSQRVVGKIIEEYRYNNPKNRPTVLFAPDVRSSIWMAEQFTNSGIPAAHIDGGQVWHDGRLEKDADGTKRDDVIDLFRSGEIKVITNRFVLREGIDLPFIYNIILACPFGNIRSFLQAIGRGLRYSPETPDHVQLVDHAGNVHRHGSPNADRDWNELFKLTDRDLYEREKNKGGEAEDIPIRCPVCGTLRRSGSQCPEPPIGCGRELGSKSRMIIQTSGKLKTITEEEFKKAEAKKKAKTPQQLWDEFFFRYRKSTSPSAKIRNVTFKMAFAMFYRKHGFYPPYNLRNIPKHKSDWAEKIRFIEKEKLRV